MEPFISKRVWSPELGAVAWLICLLGLGIRLYAYHANPGPLRPDEEFQYLEQAHRLVFGTGLIPWEFVAGIRSWLLPGTLAGFFWAARLVGDDPTIALWAIAIALSLLSLPTILCAMRWGAQAAGIPGAIAAGVLNAAWFEVAGFAPHPLADAVATSLLIPGLYFAGIGRDDRASSRALVCGGLLLGLTLAVRVQLAPVMLLAWLLVLRPAAPGDARRWRAGATLALGIAVPVLLTGALDAVTLTYPFQSFWLYAWINVGQGVATSFGSTPWYIDILVELVSWSVALVPLLVTIAAGAWRRPVLLVCAAAIIGPFLLLAHKEERFLAPSLPLLLTLAGIGGAIIVEQAFTALRQPIAAWPAGLGGAAIWLVVAALAAGRAPLWHGMYERTEMNAALRQVNADPAACGVAIYPESPWSRMPSHARYRPGVQLYAFNPNDPPARAAAFDYIIDTSRLGGDNRLAALGFDRLACWSRGPDLPDDTLLRACLWHRAQRCDPHAATPFAPPLDHYFLSAADTAP